ncbi:DUF6794 domain-containing protein [Desulfosudis oleivorans]|nr:DUF6794 domain-containing protein [Desulfosudis oleivorans]
MAMEKDRKQSHLPAERPKTIQEAVTLLIRKLPLKDRVRMANMAQDDLIDLHFTLGAWIRDNFGLWSGNDNLKRDCTLYHRESFIHIDEDEAPMIIIYELWKQLKETHRMRVVNFKQHVNNTF